MRELFIQLMGLFEISEVSQRIWTPRGFGPPGPNPLANLDPPFADLEPPTKHFIFLIYSNCKLLGDVL